VEEWCNTTKADLFFENRSAVISGRICKAIFIPPLATVYCTVRKNGATLPRPACFFEDRSAVFLRECVKQQMVVSSRNDFIAKT
jgi:hypothetical protein